MDSRNKIVIAVPSLQQSGGVSAFVRDQIAGYKKSNWNVKVVVTKSRGSDYNAIASMVECRDLSAIPLSISKVKAFASLINDLSPEILQCNNVSLAHYAFPLLKESIKPVVVIHGPEASLLRISFMMPDYVWRWVVPSLGVKEVIKQKFPAIEKTSKVKVVPHGVDPVVFNRPLENKDEINYTLVFCGSLLPHKGVDLLPAILAGVIKVYPHIKLKIIGIGEYRDAIAKKFNEIGLTDNVEWYGFLSRHEVVECFRRADILLLPTIIESFGFVIVEAMLTGVIPIVSRLNGVTDSIIEDGSTGYLLHPKDVEGYTDRILSLYSNPASLLQMRKKCILRSKSKYSIDKMFANYEKLYTENDDRVVRRPALKIIWLLKLFQSFVLNRFRKREAYISKTNYQTLRLLSSDFGK